GGLITLPKTARGHGPDRQGRRSARAVVTGAAEGARWGGEFADAVAQPVIRQGAGDPGRGRAVEADSRRPVGEARGGPPNFSRSRSSTAVTMPAVDAALTAVKQTKPLVEE